MTYSPVIFPELVGREWAKVDLGARARTDFPDHKRRNPLLDGQFCEDWVNGIAAESEADFTWGGYLEDRKHLWRGYYEDAAFITHLGIDYNVPAGTTVCVPADSVVVHRMIDQEQENGWGGRLILELSQPWNNAPYLVLGHLAHEDLPLVGEYFVKGEQIARTGKIAENGGWFPHLHVQCCTEAFFQKHAGDLAQLDGYDLASRHPVGIAADPALLVGESNANSYPLGPALRRTVDRNNPQ